MPIHQTDSRYSKHASNGWPPDAKEPPGSVLCQIFGKEGCFIQQRDTVNIKALLKTVLLRLKTIYFVTVQKIFSQWYQGFYYVRLLQKRFIIVFFLTKAKATSNMRDCFEMLSRSYCVLFLQKQKLHLICVIVLCFVLTKAKAISNMCDCFEML